jgi:hypothetical protein
MISKIILQKTKDKQESYVVDKIKLLMPEGWSYVNYCNGEEIKFFKENPLDEFPNIINKFNSLPSGQHKADLFRYYYLYIYGGIALDGDVMLYENIENIVKENSFVSGLSLDKNSLCIGYTGAFPKNPIIYEGLKFMYNVKKTDFINNYSLICKNLYDIVHNNNYDFKIKIYKEYDYKIGESAKVLNDDDKIIFIHYYKYKIIPQEISVSTTITTITTISTTTIVIGTSEFPIKFIPLTSSYKNCEFVLAKHNYADDFSFEFHYNILIVKRIDGPYGWGHNHSVDIIERN